jgi:signal transduction histidine kinase/CheY-like chemotaxis protein/HPt (histidine-containing phosphotransfer) domain-containing protein
MPGARSPYYLLTVTLAVMLVMLGLTIGAAFQIHTLNRRMLNDHVLATLDSTSRLLDTWQRQYSRSLPLLTEHPEMKRRVASLIAAHARDEITDSSELAGFHDFFTPRYIGMGYRDYSLLATDGWLLGSSVTSSVHRRIRNPALLEQLQHTLAENKPTLRPMIVETTRSKDDPLFSGTLSLVLCAPLQPTPALKAVLCLRIDASDVFIEALSAAWIGETGEAYIIDRAGRILSPSRFVKAPSYPRPMLAQTATYPSLWARQPPRGAGPLTAASADDNYPLTAVAAKLLKDGASGFLENYIDYRGQPVIGAGRWIESMNTGLIVEQDMAEAYAAHRAARTIMAGLCVMEVFLVGALGAIFMRGRRDLAVREARIRHLIGNTPALIFLKDDRGQLQLLNPTFESEVGISAARCIGKPLTDVLPPQWAQLFDSRDDAAILQGKIFDQIVELPPPLQNEKRRFFRIVRFPVYNGGGAVPHSIGTIAINTTEVWRYRMELEALNRDLERIVEERTAQYLRAQHDAEAATRAKSEFLANMSHEIRTPLNAIIGLSYLSLNDAHTPQEKNYLQKIHNAGQHLLDIINSILDFSKIEAGKLRLDNQPFLLQQLIDNVISFIWQKADSKGLEILVEIDAELPTELIGDSLRIGQVLINFCNNAVKFTERGEVELRIEQLQRDGDQLWVRFAVSDTGIGIAEAELQSLFEPFHQVDSSPTRRFEGTGLGLAISKNLAELLGGSIAARSTPGSGSTFSIEIPLRAAPAEQHPHDPLPRLQKPVLVVDDNAHARQLLAGTLRSFQFDVSEAESGSAALALIAAAANNGQPFAFIFVDWKMPGLSGIETARQINSATGKNTGPHLILVAPHHSVHELSADDTRLFSATLCKPITASAVFDTIAALLLPDFHATPRHNAPNPLTEPAELNGARVLLVEDNEINQEVAGAILRSMGMTVSVANNGLEAIDKVRNNDFDAVLMDVQMPVLDGYATTRAIRADSRIAQPPIIAMTANAMQGDREICIAAGMNDYVAKPIRPAELIQALTRWVRIAPTKTAAPASAPRTLPYGALQALGLDTQQALALLMDSDELYGNVLRRFIEEYTDAAQQVDAALQRNDFNAAARVLHTLKSSAATIGATALHQLCATVEPELKEGQKPAADMAAVFAETARLVTALAPLLRRA